MTPLSDWLAQGYAWEHRLPEATTDPAPGLAAAGYSAAVLATRRDDLRAVEGRCVVSMTQRKFLGRTIALMG